MKAQILTFLTSILICCNCFADENLFRQARTLQHSGKYDEAIKAYKSLLTQPSSEEDLSKEETVIYTEALVQLMNTFQSKGEPESCISTLHQIFEVSPILQKQCLRDYYSVMGYALSRTERMKDAEETTLKVFSLPLRHETPERYFRDYAYAAAVFYSNPDYQEDVIDWCKEALLQADLSDNISGKQWVTSMLGASYKRSGLLNDALTLFLQSKEEAQERNDDLGVLNSLHSLIDLFLYWDVPEYANIYATEAIRVENSTLSKNPMVSAQSYINKGRALQQLGQTDSVYFYIEKASKLCRSLPYNSGMVDVDLLHGTYLTEKGGDSLHLGIQELQTVARQGTATNQAKAYHQLAQTYLKYGQKDMAEIMLDSMFSLLSKSQTHIYIHVDYEPIINHYLRSGNHDKAEQYVEMMLQEQLSLKEKKLNFNLVEAIVHQQTEKKRQELEISQLAQTNQRLWFFLYSVISLIVISATVTFLLRQKKQHKIQMKKADDKLAAVVQELNQSNAEREMIAHEIDEIMQDKDNREELTSLTPSVLQKYGEPKFRQRFELLYPHFLPRLRDAVPNVTRREELLCMLLVLKQDNKEIAELLAIAPRSVLMLRHRFRQKLGISVDSSLETFIDEILDPQGNKDI